MLKSAIKAHFSYRYQWCTVQIISLRRHYFIYGLNSKGINRNKGSAWY